MTAEMTGERFAKCGNWAYNKGEAPAVNQGLSDPPTTVKPTENQMKHIPTPTPTRKSGRAR